MTPMNEALSCCSVSGVPVGTLVARLRSAPVGARGEAAPQDPAAGRLGEEDRVLRRGQLHAVREAQVCGEAERGGVRR